MFKVTYADTDFLKTMEIPLIEGRNFSDDSIMDKNDILINQTVLQYINWETATGKYFDVRIDDPVRKNVIGVVGDFNFESLHKKIQPLVILYGEHNFPRLLVRISPEKISSTLTFLKETGKEYCPEEPFDYSFLDSQFDSMYRADMLTGKIFRIFAVLTIFIACLGLYGLISFIVENSTKEIGIRKALGASVGSIVVHLSQEFAIWLLIANFIAWPVSWYVMNIWIRNFAYRAGFSIWIFLTAGITAFIIALITISFQTVRAARINPAESLKYE